MPSTPTPVRENMTKLTQQESIDLQAFTANVRNTMELTADYQDMVCSVQRAVELRQVLVDLYEVPWYEFDKLTWKIEWDNACGLVYVYQIDPTNQNWGPSALAVFRDSDFMFNGLPEHVPLKPVADTYYASVSDRYPPSRRPPVVRPIGASLSWPAPVEVQGYMSMQVYTYSELRQIVDDLTNNGVAEVDQLNMLEGLMAISDNAPEPEEFRRYRFELDGEWRGKERPIRCTLTLSAWDVKGNVKVFSFSAFLTDGRFPV